MLAISAAIILLAISAIMLGFSLLKLRLSLQWLTAVLASLFAWMLVLISRFQEPVTITLLTWEPQQLFRFSPQLVTDEITWAFSLAITCLAFSCILTDAIRLTAIGLEDPSWMEWTTLLLFTAAGIIAVHSGNLLTLVLLWVTFDLMELITWITKAKNEVDTERIVIYLAVHLGSIILLILALVLAVTSGGDDLAWHINNQSNILLFAAAFLRLVSYPLLLPGTIPNDHFPGLRITLHILPVSATLVLLARLANSDASVAPINLFISVLAFLTILSGVLWLFTKNRLISFPYWIAGIGIITMAAALLLQPSAAVSLSVILILNGGFFYLYSYHQKWLLPILLFSLLGLSLIPLTPGWLAVFLFDNPSIYFVYGFVFSIALFIAGYLYYSTTREAQIPRAERWVWIIYPIGLSFLPVTHFFLFISSFIFNNRLIPTSPSLSSTLLGFVSFAFGLLIFLIKRRGYSLPPGFVESLEKLAYLEWFLDFVRWVYSKSNRIARFINLLLEGQGGLIWTLLLLTLIISVLIQVEGIR